MKNPQWYDAQFTVTYNTKASLLSVVDWIMAPEDIQVPVPGPVNVASCGKRELENMID